MRRGLLPSCVLLVVACGDSEAVEFGDAGSDPGYAPGPAPIEYGVYQELLSGDWTLPPGSEKVLCARKTLERGYVVSSYRMNAPPGLHHSTLSAGPPSEPDGIEPCTTFDNHDQLLAGTGPNMQEIELPEGVGMQLPAGAQLSWNIHLLNPTTEEISGTSRFEVLPLESVKNVASGVMTGNLVFELPPGETTTETGRCTMAADVTVFGVSPHMHVLGRHAKIVAERAAGDVTILDEAFDFENQTMRLVDPIELAQGDTIRVDCTWDNITDEVVHFGDAADAEMCFAALLRYPKIDEPFTCIDP